MTDLNTLLAASLVDEWARAGVAVAALSPGSRSTPLALALADEPRIRTEVFLDERSAAFFALGAAKAGGRPAVVVCTSGTAAANFHPAVVEAHHAGVPLLVCTADRPPELRATGAGQATDQVKLFGAAVRWFVDVGLMAPDDAGRRYWRSLASRAWAEALGPPAGPVHLNVSFREPLLAAPARADVGEADRDAGVAGRETGGLAGRDTAGEAGGADGAAAAGAGATGVGARPWTTTVPRPAAAHPADVAWLADVVAATERGLVVVGWGAGGIAGELAAFAVAAGWPVLADGVSGLRSGANAISTYDPLLRCAPFAESHRPDLVLRLGAAPTGRVANDWLDDSVPQIVVDPAGAWLDPKRAARRRIVAAPGPLLAAVAAALRGRAGTGRSPWLDRWLAADAAARAALDRELDSSDEPFEGRVARDVVAGLPDGASLVVGSSMPVRDVESFAPPRTGLRVLANRGVNGIDGFVSTVLGVAAAVTADAAATGVSPQPVVALLGDLTLLHDAGGLLWARDRGLQATLVVLDNDGGGIFSFLPQATVLAPDRFEALFGTPHRLDLVGVAAAYGVPAVRVGSAPAVVPAVLAAVAAGGVRIVIVPTARDDNVDRHRSAWAAVAAARRDL